MTKLIVLMFFILCSPAYATTVTLQQGTDSYAGCADGRLIGSDGGDNNYGAEDTIAAGQITSSNIYRSVMRWNLSSIPADATIVSAKLSLYDKNSSSRTSDETVNVYKISDANGSWVAGTANNATQAGSSCWNYRAYNTNAWAGAAGMGTAGTDYVNTSLGSYNFTDGVSGFRDIDFNADGLVVLQSWFGTTGGNGLFLRGAEGTNGGYVSFWSCDYGTVGNRPKLIIEYSGGTVAASNKLFIVED